MLPGLAAVALLAGSTPVTNVQDLLARYGQAVTEELAAAHATAAAACSGSAEGVAPTVLATGNARAPALRAVLTALPSMTLKRRVAEVERMTREALAAQRVRAEHCTDTLAVEDAVAAVPRVQGILRSVTAEFAGWQPGDTSLERAVVLAESGTAALDDDRVADAELALLQSIAAHRGVSEAYLGLGRVRHIQGQHARALAAYAKAAELNSADPDATENAGYMLMDLGRYAEAVAPYRQVLRLYPRTLESRYNLACALARTGHPDEALEHLAVAIRVAPRVREQALQDEDLASVRALPGWKKVAEP